MNYMMDDYVGKVDFEPMEQMIHGQNVGFWDFVLASFSRSDEVLTHIVDQFVFLFEISRDEIIIWLIFHKHLTYEGEPGHTLQR